MVYPTTKTSSLYFAALVQRRKQSFGEGFNEIRLIDLQENQKTYRVAPMPTTLGQLF
jgi:hypothetical protein